MGMARCTNEIRWLKRGGKKVLQQKWQWISGDHAGYSEFRDVPTDFPPGEAIETEEDPTP